ncbi:hypothetical protein NVS55_39005 [Myxococcus stipitatus]|uniref:hypothetical protein n=1 Tax=Myxococcus stipitatus TaxID=83455 RepID=UPI0031454419
MLGQVQAMGLATSLGPLVPASAAFRAGVARPSPAPDFENFVQGEEEPSTVAIHALPVATFGFSGVGRLIALLTEALTDFSSREDLGALGAETGLYVALPDPEERGFTTGKDAFQEDPETPRERVDALGARVVQAAFKVLSVDWKGQAPRFFHGGNAAFALALMAAGEALRGRQLRSALICAVDTLASPATLRLLHDGGRLKTHDNPTGITPGETAVAMLLTAPRRGSTGEQKERPVFLRAVSLGKDARKPEGDSPTDARPLAQCILSALGPQEASTRPPVLLTDHDGQHHRAHEWGMLQLQLADRDPRLGTCPAWMPAVSFGHTGAASGGLGAAMAYRALQRGYAPGPSLLVLSSSDTGERTAIHLSSEAGGTSSQRVP